MSGLLETVAYSPALNESTAEWNFLKEASARLLGWAAVERFQRASGEDVALHCRLDFPLGRTGRQIQDDVKRVKPEDVTAFRSKEGARSIVANMAHIVLSLVSTTG